MCPALLEPICYSKDMTTTYIAGGILILILILWIGYSVLSTWNVKEPSYTVWQKVDGYEIRIYEPFVTAEVVVEGDWNTSVNQGFRELFNYITGDNQTRTSISMTAPVTETRSENISMTAPVLESSSPENRFRVVSFIMPAEYTEATLPLPNSDRITFQTYPKRMVLAKEFSWFAPSDRIAALKQTTSRYVTDNAGYQAAGEPTYAGFNAPGTFPPLRRHEIWLPIIETPEG